MVLADAYHLYLRPGATAIGADIIMALDVCPSYTDSFEEVKLATERTHWWAGRCQRAQTRSDQSLFAIVPGGIPPELRRQSASYLTSLGFPGYAIGGLSQGEAKVVTQTMIDETVALLPEDKAR